jgi:hypothetical protein
MGKHYPALYILFTWFALVPGISCCSVDPASVDPFAVRVCITKKKQVVIFTITEEKVTLERWVTF